MAKPNTLILTGYGINSDHELKFAFEKAGARADLVHVNDLIENQSRLDDYQIMAFPGGFSDGDDTGSGMAMANRMRGRMFDELQKFVNKDKLVIGICNGFQILTNLGLTPALNGHYGERQVALVHNDSARYNCRWVDLEFPSNSPWTKELGNISLPIAHGEGRFYAEPSVLARLKEKGLIGARYISEDICKYQSLPSNPNGSLENIAGITDESKRVFGFMPHPERATEFTHLPNWTLIKEKLKRAGQPIPEEGPGMQIFRNGVNYFK